MLEMGVARAMHAAPAKSSAHPPSPACLRARCRDRLSAPRGPCSLPVLREAWVNGVIDEHTLVWGQGLADWLPVKNVRTLVPQIRTVEGELLRRPCWHTSAALRRTVRKSTLGRGRSPIFCTCSRAPQSSWPRG